MKTIRWGMIGCGDVAEVKSGPGFYKADHSQLLAVMRRNGKLAEDFARRHKVPRWHDDADAIIKADDIDAVYISTNTDTHHDYTLRSAAAGKPVYVEKPMAMNADECLEMIGACKAAGVPLWVGYYRRALPRFEVIRKLLEDKAIGTVRYLVSRQFQPLPSAEALAGHHMGWRTDPARSGGGIFFEMVGHTFDIFDHLLGPIKDVHALAANQAGAYRGEDVVSVSYRFESGVVGSGCWGFDADIDEEYHEIIGDKGRIRFSVYTPVPIQLTRNGKTELIEAGDPPHVHQPMIQSIVNEMNGVGRCVSTGETALRTAKVIDAILADYRASLK